MAILLPWRVGLPLLRVVESIDVPWLRYYLLQHRRNGESPTNVTSRFASRRPTKESVAKGISKSLDPVSGLFAFLERTQATR